MRTASGWVKGLLAIGMLAGLAACQAADGTSQAPDVALVNSVMKGLGAVDPKEKGIDYKPRAPLAMPAEPTNLPQPETEVAGTASPDWPVKRNNQQYEELVELYTEDDRARYSGSDRDLAAPLSPQQMRGFKITGVTGEAHKNRDIAAARRAEDVATGEPLTRAEQTAEWERLQALKAQQAGATTDAATATRRYLTEPPVAYSTPSADAPMPNIIQTEQQRPTNFDPYDDTPLDPRCLEGETKYCR